MWSSGTERQGGGCVLWVEDEVGEQGGQIRGGEKAGSERRWLPSDLEANGTAFHREVSASSLPAWALKDSEEVNPRRQRRNMDSHPLQAQVWECRAQTCPGKQ